jgi:hypothetical protein
MEIAANRTVLSIEERQEVILDRRGRIKGA